MGRRERNRIRHAARLVFFFLTTVCGLGGCAPSSTPPSEFSPQKPAPTSIEVTPIAPIPAATLAPTEPAPAITKAPIVRRPGAYANLDPDDDYTVGPPDALPECEDELTKAGVHHNAAHLPVHTVPKSKIVCGAPQVVVYLRGPGNIAYDPAPLLTCSMALALASFERIVQEEAQRVYGSPVVEITQLGTYACREIARYPGTVSEHAYANAIDLSRFRLKNGVTIDVLHDFDKSDAAPEKRAGLFLRTISQRANDEDVFSHVLTPFFDDGHKNHFHLDLARFRADGTRPQRS